jgi:D-psicose/D-tagatose/L-ribulose 3-epimerase
VISAPLLWVALAALASTTVPPSGPPSSAIAIGYCTRDLAQAKAAGFDYAEFPVREFARLSEEDFVKLLESHKSVGLPTPVGYLFLPSDLKVVGPAVDNQRIAAYVSIAFERAQTLGMKIVTFGSGDARRVPEGFSKEAAFRQLVAFGRSLAPEAAKRGIVVAVEPQRQQETNIINSVAEGLELVKAVDRPGFELMVDFYHLAVEREDPAILLKAGAHVRHVHFANPEKRVFPLDPDEYDYSGFFDNLRRSGYRGRLSIEAATKAFEAEAPRAIAFLRTAIALGVRPSAAKPSVTP